MNNPNTEYLLRRMNHMGKMIAKGYKIHGDYMYLKDGDKLFIFNYIEDRMESIKLNDLDYKISKLLED